jgi:hypothetical protein
MEATVATQDGGPPAEPEPTFDGEAEATRSSEELFQWSAYVHVGTRAADCEHGEDGECKDPKHFHAWVCLPNIFQMRDIGEKARAAKARRKRALRDPESDVCVVLEDDLADIVADRYDDLLDAVATANVEKELTDIAAELAKDERFENQQQDAEELRRLSALPEEERDKEAYERLQADVLAYGEKFEEIVNERQKAERISLEKLSREDVIEIERRSRIDNISTETYLHTYYTWAMYIGTRQPTANGFPSRRKFSQPEDLKVASPEVVTAVREAVRQLEERTTVRSDAAGNS